MPCHARTKQAHTRNALLQNKDDFEHTKTRRSLDKAAAAAAAFFVSISASTPQMNMLIKKTFVL